MTYLILQMIGALLIRNASFIVAGETCERSISIPKRFISCKTASPNAVRSAQSTRVVSDPPCASNAE